MREIKFRAWHDGRMIYGVGLTVCAIIEYDWSSICTGYVEGTDPDCYEQKCVAPQEKGFIGLGLVELMQYTGLKDKNGKEIYEGDIVKSGYLCSDEWIETNAVIKWEAEYAQFIQDMPHVEFDQMMDVQCEVIGNIYENKELLDD